MSIVKSLAHFMWDLLYIPFGEGTWRLRPHEWTVIEAAVDFLPEHAQALLRSQLSGITFVQRTHSQISLPRFYTKPYCPDRRAIEDSEYAAKIVDVQIDVEGVKQVAQVEFFQGRIDSVQFKRPAKFYAGKTVKATGVRFGKLGRAHAAAIDRLEHGRGH